MILGWWAGVAVFIIMGDFLVCCLLVVGFFSGFFVCCLFVCLNGFTRLEVINKTIYCLTVSEITSVQTRKEGNVLFNDALNTFYYTVIWRRTYGKGPLR